MRHIKYILLLLLVFMPALASSANEKADEEGGLNIPEIVLEHLSDSYEWHIATYGDNHISIPLPIIIRSDATGEWHFCTSHSLPDNFYFNKEMHGKIYEKLPDGSTVRPLDLSITKTVAQIWIVVIVLICIFTYCSRWYKNHDERSQAPSGFVGMMEMLITTINDDVIKSSIGEKHYRKYSPYLLTVFFFILTANIMGLIPFFPGGANVTGNINVTFFLALCTMIAINLFGNKHYWKDIFWPDVPWWLKVPVPMMPFIEFFGIFTKPFALMIRLFANMLAGHMAMLVLTCLIFISASMGPALNGTLTVASVLFNIFMNALELLVAFIQAYVFTMLSAVFIGLAQEGAKVKAEEK